MTLNAVFRWKHPDSTLDMNKRLQTLVPRAIFDGGQITPGAGLTVVVSPFKAISYDGMLCYDDAVQTLAVVASQTNYILVRAKYVTGTTPTLQWEVKSQAQYNADPDKNYLIVFGTVTLGAVVVVTNADISTLDRDAVDPMQRSSFRGSLDNPLLLPTHPPIQNHDGDFYFVLNSGGGLPGQTFYFWESGTSTWETFATGSFNNETTSMYDVIRDGERNRIEQGSGVIAGIRPTSISPDATQNAWASDLDISIIETPTVPAQIGINTFSAIVNGHYVQPYARNITLSAKPALGDRYDLIFLEVWREAITTPENWDFPRNPDGTLTYTISQVSDNVETSAWQAGTGGDNFDLNELQADDHAWLVTRYRFSTVDNVTSGSLYDNTLAAALATNIDGAAFSAAPGMGSDLRVWQATSATPFDGVSWAIPLYVIRRTSAEDHTIGQAIREFRTFVRYVFPVYALTDVSNASRLALDTQFRQQSEANDALTPCDKPSGFVDVDVAVTTSGAANTIKFGNDATKIRIRGYDEVFYKVTANLGTPPASPTYDRTLVYIKMSITMYADHVNRPNVQTSVRYRPWIPSRSIGSFQKGQGWKRGYVNFETVVEVFNNLNYLDEDDAMAAAGWTKGDLMNASSGKEYVDGGVWSRAVAVDVDDRIHPFETEWAIPVCLVHRRNTGAWNYVTNRNGTTASRPDGKTLATVIHPDDLVDLRRLIDVDEARLQLMLEEDIDKLMRGQLRTRMATKWAGSAGAGDVAGSRILQSDLVTKGAGGTSFEIIQKDHKKIYSDAREFQPVAVSFPLAVDYVGDLAEWNSVTGVLTIKAPDGAYIVRNLPEAYIVDGQSANATYLDFLGQPCWTTQYDKAVVYPTYCELKFIDATINPNEEKTFFGTLVPEDPAFTITARDALDHATNMEVTVTPPGTADILCVSFWVHYDRSVVAPYSTNYGLAEIPDEVHAVIGGPNTGAPETLNIGTLYTTVRKTVAGAATVISAANVLAASGTSGTTAVIMGIGYINFGSSPTPTLSSIVISTVTTPNDTATITFTAPIAMDIDVVVFYETDDVTRWVEVGRGGKSLRAFYAWHEEVLDFSMGGVPAAYAFDIGTSTWHNAEVSGMHWNMPLILTSAVGIAGPWTQHLGLVMGVGYRNSNMISFDPSAYSAVNYMRVVVPKWTAPTNVLADEILLHYTYTPYQGLSGDGAVATPAVAVPRLKDTLHGRIVANSDHYVSQSGACSIYGGVDTWSGLPARVPSFAGSMGADRFGAYNMTQLVKDTKANGTFDLQVTSGLAQTMYAAAILRLPFPMNPNMQTGVIYHEGTFDFDIDPGREGASVGMYGYAPGYYNKHTQYDNTTAVNGLHYSQFVNGLCRMSLPGEPRQTDYSHVVQANEYQLSAGNTGDSTLQDTDYWLISRDGGNIDSKLLIPFRQHRNCIVGLLMTKIVWGTAGDLAGDYGIICKDSGVSPPGSFLDVEPPEYTCPIALANPNIYYVCYNPGTVMAYLTMAYDAHDFSLLYSSTFEAGILADTLVVQESPRSSYTLGTLFYALGSALYTDLIRIPMSSSSIYGGNLLSVNFAHSYAIGNASLRGRTIGYPASWGITTTTALENLIVASTSVHAGYGRGLYLGTVSSRYSMPVMVPGSGSGIQLLCTHNNVLVETTAQPPAAFPIGPSTSPFDTSPKRWMTLDHGGPIGYCFYGLTINPSDDEHHGQAVMQISGGPFMGAGGTSGAQYSSAVVDGTAIDAFWPSHRPLIKLGQ